jgi:threonine synthase
VTIERWLSCNHCSAQYPFGPRFEGCSACDPEPYRAPLEVQLDLEAAGRALDRDTLRTARGGLWRFGPLLPLQRPEQAVSLGEGGTPLVKIAALNTALGLPNLLLKNEAANPTWAFKDRLNSLNASLTREFGFQKIIASSTGNHGASAAAYAAAAGLRSLVLVPHETPMVIRQMIEAYGGRTVATEWQGRSGLLTELVQQHHWFPSKSALAAPVSNPFGLEAYKTIGYELVIETVQAPLDYVFVVVGGGDGIYGIFKGLREFRDLGIATNLPRVIAAEPAGTSPVTDAFEQDREHVAAIEHPTTMATSVGEGIASDHALRALRGSDGFGVRVSESEILEAMRSLARVGIAAESASCVTVAAARRAVAEGRVPSDARMACVLTSSGIKWPEQLALLGREPASIEPTLEALQAVVDF